MGGAVRRAATRETELSETRKNNKSITLIWEFLTFVVYVFFTFLTHFSLLLTVSSMNPLYELSK